LRTPAKRKTPRRTNSRRNGIIRRREWHDEPAAHRGFLPGESLVRVPDDELWWEPIATSPELG